MPKKSQRALPPEPGIGYRLLRGQAGRIPGEIIMRGDETLHAVGWLPSACIGEKQPARGQGPWRRRRTDEPVPSTASLETLAREIVDELFTSGNGRAARLVLVSSIGGDMGGLGDGPAYDRILAILQQRKP